MFLIRRSLTFEGDLATSKLSACLVGVGGAEVPLAFLGLMVICTSCASSDARMLIVMEAEFSGVEGRAVGERSVG
jgi:hypothetical protein